jgi:hypothetical protein
MFGSIVARASLLQSSWCPSGTCGPNDYAFAGAWCMGAAGAHMAGGEAFWCTAAV